MWSSGIKLPRRGVLRDTLTLTLTLTLTEERGSPRYRTSGFDMTAYYNGVTSSMAISQTKVRCVLSERTSRIVWRKWDKNAFDAFATTCRMQGGDQSEGLLRSQRVRWKVREPRRGEPERR